MSVSCCVMAALYTNGDLRHNKKSRTQRTNTLSHVAIMCWKYLKTNYLWMWLVCPESTCLSSHQRLSNYWLIFFGAVSVYSSSEFRTIDTFYLHCKPVKLHVYELGTLVCNIQLLLSIVFIENFRRSLPQGPTTTMKWWLSFQSWLCIDFNLL